MCLAYSLGTAIWLHYRRFVNSFGVAIPANRIGYTVLSVGQLKVMQEIITLTVFVPFAVFYMKEPLKLDYLWAGFCLVGAAYFIFRDKL